MSKFLTGDRAVLAEMRARLMGEAEYHLLSGSAGALRARCHPDRSKADCHCQSK